MRRLGVVERLPLLLKLGDRTGFQEPESLRDRLRRSGKFLILHECPASSRADTHIALVRDRSQSDVRAHVRRHIAFERSLR